MCVSHCAVNFYLDSTHTCQPCDSQCNANYGCTGPLASNCLECKTLIQPTSNGFVCLATCSNLEFNENNTCTPCNTECLEGCNGPSAENCIGSCAHLSLNGTCVPGLLAMYGIHGLIMQLVRPHTLFATRRFVNHAIQSVRRDALALEQTSAIPVSLVPSCLFLLRLRA